MAAYIIAHDLGTSGNKATVFDETGDLICSYTHSYGTNFFNSNWAEQDPNDWWKAICTCTKDICNTIDPKDVAAVTFSGQMMGCLCVDKQGEALYPHLLYCDQRAETETARLIDALGFEYIYNTTGHRPSASYSIEKLMWIQNNEPAIYGKTYKMLQAKDYMICKLTGVFMTERNDASGTNAMDLMKNCWSEEILKAADIDISFLPDIYKSTDVVGYVTKEAAALTGLLEGTPVVAGAGDGGCATIGVGSVTPGITYSNIGSSAWTSSTSTEPVKDPSMRTFTWAHPITGLFQPCGTMQTAGSSYKWYVDSLLKRFASADNNTIYSELNRGAAKIPVGSNGLLFLPYLMGERTPWWDPNAKGCIIGLGLDSTAEEIANAIHESIAMSLNFSYDIFKQHEPIQRCRISGGGARMKNLVQILSSVTGLPIEIPRYLEESTSLGAALIGGVGTSVYSSFNLIEEMNPTESVIQPDMEKNQQYKKLQSIFEKAYLQNKELFQDLMTII